MKSSLFALFLLFSILTTYAQTQIEDTSKESEISTNLLDLVIAGTLNVNYERLYDNNQSLYIGANFFDSYAYYDVGYIDKTTAISINAAYLVYFSKHKDHAGFFFFPQLKARTGEISVDDGYYYYNDGFSESYVEDKYTYDVSGISAGFGIGHKWMFSNKFTLTLKGDVARNLGNFDTDYLSNVELRFGVNFGYRF